MTLAIAVMKFSWDNGLQVQYETNQTHDPTTRSLGWTDDAGGSNIAVCIIDLNTREPYIGAAPVEWVMEVDAPQNATLSHSGNWPASGVVTERWVNGEEDTSRQIWLWAATTPQDSLGLRAPTKGVAAHAFFIEHGDFTLTQRSNHPLALATVTATVGGKQVEGAARYFLGYTAEEIGGDAWAQAYGYFNVGIVSAPAPELPARWWTDFVHSYEKL